MSEIYNNKQAITDIVLSIGNSTDNYYIGFDATTVLSDPNWRAYMVISGNIGDKAIVQRDLPINTSTITVMDELGNSVSLPALTHFIFRIKPSESAKLKVGTYNLAIVIENLDPAFDFKREVLRTAFSVQAPVGNIQ